MANEYTPDLITLIGDDGKEIEFEILDIIENDEGKFYVLYPFFENPEDAVNDSGEYYIFEVTEIGGEEELAEIEDDDKLDRIAAVFEERYNEEFYDEDEYVMEMKMMQYSLEDRFRYGMPLTDEEFSGIRRRL